MDRSEAESIGIEALELAADGRWPQLLEMELPAQVLELLRRKQQLNPQIGNLEEQEKVLWNLIVEMLLVDS